MLAWLVVVVGVVVGIAICTVNGCDGAVVGAVAGLAGVNGAGLAAVAVAVCCCWQYCR